MKKKFFNCIMALMFAASGLVLFSCGSSESKKAEEAARIEAMARAKADSIRLEEERMAERLEEQRREEEAKSPKGKGWRFILGRLKSPSSAQLVGYVSPNESACVKMANALNLADLSIAMFEFDAQNGYGATLRQRYLVFFKNNEPMHAEDASTLSGNMSLLRSCLMLHGFNLNEK